MIMINANKMISGRRYTDCALPWYVTIQNEGIESNIAYQNQDDIIFFFKCLKDQTFTKVVFFFFDAE